MNDEQNKVGEGEQVNLNSSVSPDENTDQEAKTLDEIEKENQQEQWTKNLVSAVIVLAGLFIGSLFVDAAQLLSGSGYSEKALKNAEVFEGAGKTWVAYNDPIVKATVLTVSEEELKDCPRCDATDVVSWIRKFMPTVVAEKVDIESPAGKMLVEQYGIKSVPAFLFDKQIEKTDFYVTEAKMLFNQKEESFVLNAAQLGVPVGKYLQGPSVTVEDSVMGNPEAKVKIVVFSDYQCPFCKNLYTTITKVAKEYGDQIALVYKEFPLESIHAQARNASNAALCAKEQGKFWEMSDLLYTNQTQWGASTNKDVFKGYAQRLRLDSQKFNTCLEQQPFDAKIAKDLQEGNDFGVSGTPSGFVNNQQLSGPSQETDLKKMIDEELKK